MFYTRRIADSNGDGKLGFDDNGIVCMLDLDGKNFTMISDTADDYVHLAYNPVARELLVQSGNTLYTVNAENPGAFKKAGEISDDIVSAFFDYEGALFLEKKDGSLMILENQESALSSRLPCISVRGESRILHDTGNNTYIKMHGDRREYSFPADKTTVLFPLDKSRDLLLNTVFGAYTLFIGNAEGRSYQTLYAFPNHTTFIAFSDDFRQAVFLGTFDTDEDNRINPAGLDKSALYQLNIAE